MNALVSSPSGALPVSGHAKTAEPGAQQGWFGVEPTRPGMRAERFLAAFRSVMAERKGLVATAGSASVQTLHVAVAPNDMPSATGPGFVALSAEWGNRCGELARSLLAGVASIAMALSQHWWRAPGSVKAGSIMLLCIPVGLSLLAREVRSDPPPRFSMIQPAADLIRVDESWRSIAAPIPAYNLEAPELGRGAPVYRARQNAGGGRQDTLIWGETGVKPVRASLAGSLTVERNVNVPPSDTLFVETARRAALAGVSIVRMSQSLDLETKFGMAEIAETEMEALGSSYSCQSFRVTGGPAAWRANGWFCGSGKQSVTRDSLGCMIDRIDLITSGNDKALRSWFAAAERARKTCGETRAVSVKPGSQAVPPRAGDKSLADMRLRMITG